LIVDGQFIAKRRHARAPQHAVLPADWLPRRSALEPFALHRGRFHVGSPVARSDEWAQRLFV